MAGASAFPYTARMTYQVLARKWRPHNFAQMVGQSHVLRALANGLAADRLHHAYLFTGTRGVGKTTVARILAKCLNCEAAGVTAEPCGQCAACQDIDAGRFVDLIEVDAASRTKVEDTRDLLDNVQYAPSRGRYKIYLIDEVHMLSSHSFNALLKTLEEPPEHVKFLLATTDPQKLPVTVLSRCLQFNLKPLSPALIANQLQTIAQAEGITADTEALEQIAVAADGSMRDALSLTDQAVAYGNGVLNAADVQEMLGSVDKTLIKTLVEHLAVNDGPALLGCAKQLAERSPNYASALADLQAIFHALTLHQVVGGGDEWQAKLAEQLSPETIQLYYQITLHGRRDLPMAPDPFVGFEMTLLRMLAFTPAEAAAPAPTATPAVPEPKPAPKPAAPAPKPAPKPAPPADTDWHALAAALPVSGIARALVNHCDWVGREAGKVTLRIEPGHDHLLAEAAITRLTEALSAHFGEPVKLDLQVGKPKAETPAAAAERTLAEREAAAVEAIEKDPTVAALRETFDAEIIPDSIRPQRSDDNQL